MNCNHFPRHTFLQLETIGYADCRTRGLSISTTKYDVLYASVVVCTDPVRELPQSIQMSIPDRHQYAVTR